jgi:cytochrome P450
MLADIDFGADAAPDLEQRLTELVEAGHRVVPVRYLGQIAWAILRHEDVAAIFANEAEVPAAASYERVAMPSMGRTLLAMRGEQHRVNRALVTGVLAPAAIRRRVESLLAPIANRLIDEISAPGPVDLVAAFTKRYPFNVISGMLGIDIDDEARLTRWVDLLFVYPTDPERALQARAEITAFLTPIIAQRRRSPGDDIISALVTAEVDGQRLSEEEILSFIRLLYPAGADTTFLAMGSMLRDVIADRALYRRLLAHPEQRAGAVEEALRLRSPVALQIRYTENPITVSGVAIPANSWLLYGIAPANRDPDRFRDPHDMVLDRRQDDTITFGRGPHFCLGRHLAREELRIALSLVLDRLPGLRLADPDPPAATGAILRGVRRLPVLFDAVLPAP